MLKPDQQTRLSKIISHALRHAPDEYGLKLDETGSVALADLISAIQKSNAEYEGLEEFDVIDLVDSAEKARHEIAVGRIRALYGHSIANTPRLIAEVPPAELFHGTSPEAVKKIMKEGLQPMARRFVHLSPDKEIAGIVGRRKHPNPAILTILARHAAAVGVEFFCATDRIWLARKVSPEFIRASP